MLITLHGPNQHLLEEKSYVHIDRAHPLDYVILEAPTAQELHTALQAMPLMGTWRVVQVLSIENMKDNQNTVDLIEDREAENILLFTLVNFSGKTKIKNHLTFEGSLTACPAYDRSAIQDLLDHCLYVRGLKMNESDRDLFLFIVDSNPYAIEKELDTLRDLGLCEVSRQDFVHIDRHSKINIYNIVDQLFIRESKIYQNLMTYPDIDRMITSMAYTLRIALIVKGAIIVRANIANFIQRKLSKVLPRLDYEKLGKLYVDVVELQYNYNLSKQGKRVSLINSVMEFRQDI